MTIFSYDTVVILPILVMYFDNSLYPLVELQHVPHRAREVSFRETELPSPPHRHLSHPIPSTTVFINIIVHRMYSIIVHGIYIIVSLTMVFIVSLTMVFIVSWTIVVYLVQQLDCHLAFAHKSLPNLFFWSPYPFFHPGQSVFLAIPQLPTTGQKQTPVGQSDPPTKAGLFLNP